MRKTLWSKLCHNWLIKCIGAGVVALGVLSLFSMFYYNPPIHVSCGNGATDYTRESNKFWSRGTEGFAHGTTDVNGYNNVDGTTQDNVGILLMGSSQTEGLYVDAKKNMGYVLNDLLQENGYDMPVYNIGMSSHGFLRTVTNLEAALDTYHPSDYVVLETDLVDFTSEELDAALNDNLEPLATYNDGFLYQMQRIPYVKLVYQQYQNYKGNQVDSQAFVESAVDDGVYDVQRVSELLAQIETEASEHDVTPILYYFPHFYLEEDGTLKTSNVDGKISTFASLCEEHHIIFLDMTDDFLTEYEQNHHIVSGFSNTKECYGHLNQYGHRLIAQALYDAVTQKE